jgi:CBS domain containing-hemolysin-like protein
MEYIRFAIKTVSFGLLAATIIGYAYLVYIGDLPKPDVNAIVNQVAPAVATSGSTLAVVAISLCFVLTAIAPFIYAARSGDGFTVVVSIVALVVCFTLLVYSRTVIDMVLAAIVYFTSAFISVIMYSTNRLADAITRSSRQDATATPQYPEERDPNWTRMLTGSRKL